MNMKKIDELITSNTKLAELLGKKQPEKKCNVLLWIFAVIGVVATIAAIAYAVYRYMNPEYFDDLDFDDFDDFEDDFEDEDEDIFVDEEAALNNPSSSETAETN